MGPILLIVAGFVFFTFFVVALAMSSQGPYLQAKRNLENAAWRTIEIDGETFLYKIFVRPANDYDDFDIEYLYLFDKNQNYIMSVYNDRFQSGDVVEEYLRGKISKEYKLTARRRAKRESYAATEAEARRIIEAQKSPEAKGGSELFADNSDHRQST